MCPLADPEADARAVLTALDRGKIDKARKKLAAMRLDSSPHPELPLLTALTDFADQTDPAGTVLLGLLDPSLPACTQIQAEIFALRGEPCRASALYAELPDAWPEARRLRERGAALSEACLMAFAEQVDALWTAGEFEAMETLWKNLPSSLKTDGRAARALFPEAVLTGDRLQARALLDRLPPRDREPCSHLVSALDLDPSLRLSYLKQNGGSLLREPLGQALYAQTLDEWLVSNMPSDFRQAWEAPVLTQRDLALLLCLHFPGLKGGAIPGSDLPPAILEDPQADCLAPLLSQGFFPTFEAGAPVSAEAAVQTLSNALESAGLAVPCAGGIGDWIRCGLLPANQAERPFSGREWSLLAHRTRGDLP